MGRVVVDRMLRIETSGLRGGTEPLRPLEATVSLHPVEQRFELLNLRVHSRADGPRRRTMLSMESPFVYHSHTCSATSGETRMKRPF